MDHRNKTRAVAVYPDGRRVVIRRRGRMWYWDNRGSASSHMDSVKANVEALGGTVVREPNPHYRPPQPPRLRYADECFARLFG